MTVSAIIHVLRHQIRGQLSVVVDTGCYPSAMDLADARTFELFLEIYGTLPRAGPGSTEDTLATEIADEAENEIETFRRFSEFYSYGFFVVRPS